MREQLEQYVNLLFAGTQDCEDIKQEILQNTLDRYDDLLAEGKVPEAAYRLAISGIGDISEILGAKPQAAPLSPHSTESSDNDTPFKKLLRAIAVGLYIISLLPLIILCDMGMETLGLGGTIVIVAVATVLIMLGSKKESTQEQTPPEVSNPKSELHKSIDTLISVVGFVLYFLISFVTGAWYITWLIFPIMGAVKGLVKAIIDLKEAVEHES